MESVLRARSISIQVVKCSSGTRGSTQGFSSKASPIVCGGGANVQSCCQPNARANCRRLGAFQGLVSRTHFVNCSQKSSTTGNPWLLNCDLKQKSGGARKGPVTCGLLPIDPWNPNMQVDSQSIASQLFAASLLPYLGFLYHLTQSKTAPKLTLFGFYFLLVFVGATIPAGIYAKLHYGTSLSNVDWLHGGAESFLTLTNLFIVIGLRQALRKDEQPTEPSVLPDLDPEGERHPEAEASSSVRR